MENITWSSSGNFLSIPTDCPQRNERLGWAGDISVFSRTATYLADVSQFLRRYVQSMRDVQRSDGRFPDIAPLGGGFGGCYGEVPESQCLGSVISNMEIKDC